MHARVVLGVGKGVLNVLIEREVPLYTLYIIYTHFTHYVHVQQY